MKDVVVVTDSSSGLPPDMARDLGISIIPIPVNFDCETYLDGVTITHEEFYQRLERGELPRTSQPSPGDLLCLYKNLLEKARSIVSVHVSALASGTCQAARLAAESIPKADITVVDSQVTSMGLGFLALEGAQTALAGGNRDAVVSRMKGLRSRLSLYATLPTVEYLMRSGRLSRGKALLASALSIKPMLCMKDGLLVAFERPRSMGKALERMIYLTALSVGDAPVRASVIYTRTRERAEEFAERVRDNFNCLHDPYVLEMGPSLGSHGGPGILGLVTLRLDEGPRVSEQA